MIGHDGDDFLNGGPDTDDLDGDNKIFGTPGIDICINGEVLLNCP